MKEFYHDLTDRETDETKVLAARISESLKKMGLNSQAVILSDYPHKKIYSRDLADIPVMMEKLLFKTVPLLVIQPVCPEDLTVILQTAQKENLPVFPRGIASWGLGGAVPTTRGLVVDFSPLDKIYSPDLENQTITVEAGARWGKIDEKLENYGLMVPVSPSSRFSTVGGWVATGGYGLNSLSYGHLSSWVSSLKVATPAKGLLELTPDNPDFEAFFNTEGQMGLIYQVTLKLLKRPAIEYPHLIYFDSPTQAFDYAREWLEQGPVPLTLNFKGRELMAQTRRGENLPLEEKDALLFAFTDQAQENEFFKRYPGLNQAPAYLARFLWQERFNPMMLHSKAPSILASEVILPQEKASEFVKKAEALGKNYQVPLYFEFHYLKTDNKPQVLAMTLFNCDRRKPAAYYAYLSLVPVLTRMGIKLGGKPYGIGIWNVPFLPWGFDEQKIKKIQAAKAEFDPGGIMNPRKFTAIQSRFYNLPGRMFHPLLYGFGMDLLLSVSPLTGMLIPGLNLSFQKYISPLQEYPFACTSCGNCLSVCPAYLTTKKETSCPRGKLSLARRLVKGKKLDEAVCREAFFCTSCGNCEKVCQNLIPHLSLWEELESELMKVVPRPDNEIIEWLNSLGQNPQYLELIGSKPWENF